MALTTITLHGQFLEPVTAVPAVGTVTFKILHNLNDNVANVVYSPMTFTATLDVNGEFSLVLPVTDNADITPLNWSYWGYIDTDIFNSGVISFQLPESLGPVAEFADLMTVEGADCTPDGSACAPIGVVGEIAALQDDVDVLEVTTSALVGQVNTITPIVLQNQADIAVLEGDLVTLTATVDGLLITINNIDAAWITSGTLDYQRLGGVVAENLSVVFGRATLVNPGTAADVWQWQYNGNRVTYINEYSCLRVRGVPDNQTPARFMSHATRDNTAHPIFQVSLSDAATHKFQVLADGQILNNTGLDMNPTAPVAVTFTAPAATAGSISDGSGSGAPYSLTTTLFPAFNRVYLDGAVTNSGGAPIAGGTVLFTVTAAHRPTAWVQFNERTSTTLSARVSIRPDGTVRLDQALAAGATCSFDGLNYRKN